MFKRRASGRSILTRNLGHRFTAARAAPTKNHLNQKGAFYCAGLVLPFHRCGGTVRGTEFVSSCKRSVQQSASWSTGINWATPSSHLLSSYQQTKDSSKQFTFPLDNNFYKGNWLLCLLAMGACGSTAAAASVSSSSGGLFDNKDRSMMESSSGKRADVSKRLETMDLQDGTGVPASPTARTESEGSAEVSGRAHTISGRTSTSGDSRKSSVGSHSTCEGSQAPSPQKLQQRGANLMRRATLRRLEQERSKDKLEDKYQVEWDKVLGEGAFGAVYLGTKLSTGEKVAVKKISKKYTDQSEFQREMDALLHLHNRGGHPNICSLQEHFDEGKHYFLVLDLIRGGEMFDHLIQMGAYSEADAARLLREVASALAFCHGIGIVHGDLKPENIMLSTPNASDAVVKLVDFGGSEVLGEDTMLPYKTASDDRGRTPAYCPPEILRSQTVPMGPSMDMWSLGIIMYIMLTGLHPFDLTGRTPDKEVELRIVNKHPPPLRNTAITAHLSESAIELIERLMEWDPRKRMTAMEMLNHAWVKGETASKEKIADSDKKLSKYRRFQSSLERRVFEDIVQWSDDSPEEVMRKTSLVERAFRSLDPQCKGYLTTKDLKRVRSGNALSQMAAGLSSTAEDNDDDDEKDEAAAPLSLSGFSDLLSQNMKNKYYEKGRVLYREGDYGNHMYFINSGTIEVTTKEGTVARRSQGDFFGEGALLHPKKIRSATITCITPVHAIEISREYFEKYLASSEKGLAINLREKDKTRKRNRAKTILRLQNHLQRKNYNKGDFLFQVGEDGEALYILEKGAVDVEVDGNCVFHVYEGDLCGEHSLILGRPRNTNAVCVSEEGCVALRMNARDFYSLYDSSSTMRDSLRELCLRREFQKALVRKTGKPFDSSDDLNEVFRLADEDGDGVINLEELTKLLVNFDHSLSRDEIQDILGSMDLMKKGQISISEFKYIFASGIDSKHHRRVGTGC